MNLRLSQELHTDMELNIIVLCYMISFDELVKHCDQTLSQLNLANVTTPISILIRHTETANYQSTYALTTNFLSQQHHIRTNRPDIPTSKDLT